MYESADFLESGPDQLAEALEGRQVGARARQWVARVYGVHRDERSCWIQVAKEDDDTACVVLRCSPRATVEQATAALGRWQPSTTLTLLVLNVMSVAR